MAIRKAAGAHLHDASVFCASAKLLPSHSLTKAHGGAHRGYHRCAPLKATQRSCLLMATQLPSQSAWPEPTLAHIAVTIAVHRRTSRLPSLCTAVCKGTCSIKSRYALAITHFQLVASHLALPSASTLESATQHVSGSAASSFAPPVPRPSQDRRQAVALRHQSSN